MEGGLIQSSRFKSKQRLGIIDSSLLLLLLLFSSLLAKEMATSETGERSGRWVAGSIPPATNFLLMCVFQ